MKQTYTVANLINQMDTFQKICFLKKTEQSIKLAHSRMPTFALKL